MRKRRRTERQKEREDLNTDTHWAQGSDPQNPDPVLSNLHTSRDFNPNHGASTHHMHAYPAINIHTSNYRRDVWKELHIIWGVLEYIDVWVDTSSTKLPVSSSGPPSYHFPKHEHHQHSEPLTFVFQILWRHIQAAKGLYAGTDWHDSNQRSVYKQRVSHGTASHSRFRDSMYLSNVVFFFL